MILLILGAGLGLTTVSPWSNAGASATAVGVGAIIWLSSPNGSRPDWVDT